MGSNSDSCWVASALDFEGLMTLDSNRGVISAALPAARVLRLEAGLMLLFSPPGVVARVMVVAQCVGAVRKDTWLCL